MIRSTRFQSTRRLSKAARQSARLLVCLALLSQGLLFTAVPRAAAQGKQASKQFKDERRPALIQNAPAQPAGQGVGTKIEGTPISPTSVGVIDFKQTATLISKQPKRTKAAVQQQVIHAPGSIDDTPPGAIESAPPAPAAPVEQVSPAIPSPAPSSSFLAQDDVAAGGFFFIPPDTNGAVGLDKLFSNTNSNYRVADKATGAAASTVPMETFWAPTTATGLFDPQIQYDPYNNRWIVVATSNAQTANSSIVVGLSDTADPGGTYHLYRFIVGCAAGAVGCNANGEWADFPMLGFNKNWVAISVNMFSISGGTNVNDKTLVIDYPQLLGNTSAATLFSGTAIGFCNHPVTTFSATEPTLYLAQHLSSGGATYKLSTITGTPSAPVFTIGATKTRPGGGWTQPGGDILPQQCITAPCPATNRFLDSGDAQVRSNPVFRNGGIYYAQTVGIPAGGLTHTAAQWTQLDTAGNVVQGGRVEDPTATNANGGKWYAYPSVSVNKNNDVLMGFTQFASNQFASAGYTYRTGTDAAGTMRDPVISKAGEDYYNKTFGSTRNRWGDYSHTFVDPSNDRDMWTVQEYAATRSPAACDPTVTSTCSRWGTWWAKIATPAGAGDLLISEYRTHGANGAQDEFIELYNNSNAPLTVTTLDGTAGYAVTADDGITRCTVPTGTTIPARGHYLCANNTGGTGYSLSNYGGAGNATPNATYTTDIPDTSGLAVFRTTATPAAADRLDSSGPATEANALYKEGTGTIPPPASNLDYSFVRDQSSTGVPKDTGDNASDFLLVEPFATAGARLGAAGPENITSPIQRNAVIKVALIDVTCPGSGPVDGAGHPTGPPNACARQRDTTPGPGATSSFGTLSIRRKFINTTTSPVTRLRFRVVDITTAANGASPPVGTADLRLITSAPYTAGVFSIEGLTLETPPAQPNGGAYNSTVTVTLGAPLGVGNSINVHFLLGVQQTGSYRFFINVEALP